ncbi:MAG: hypothetical protein ACE5GX_12415 [Thermoanaerobaculia bacterium]
MIISAKTAVSFLAWVAERLGLALELPESLLADTLDERSVSEDLRYGTD